MNQLVIKEQNGDLTMSSRDIAELCDKRHDHVMRDIRMMLDELSLSPYLGYEENQTLRILYDAHTKRAREYHLPRRECDILIAGYSIKYRAAIVDRWRELESSKIATLPDFTNPAIAAKFTAKGISWIAGKWAIHCIQEVA